MTNLPPVPSAFFNQQGQQGQNAGPIITSLPSTTTALTRKYEQLGPQLQQLPPHIVNALYTYDQQRAMRGAQPLGAKQTFNVLSSALTGQAATPPKQRSTKLTSIPGNAVRDLSNMLSSIPRLPHAIAKEITSLPEIPEGITAALAQPTIGSKLAALTEVPGVRMLPTAYTIGNIARGEPGELLRHPLMSLLDIYPAAKSVGLTKAVSKQVAAVSNKAANTTIGKDIIMDVKANRGVQYLQEAFGRTARNDAVQYALANKTLERNLAADPSVAFADKWASLTPEEKVLGSDAAEAGQAAIDALPEHLQPFAEEIQHQASRIASLGDELGVVKRTENYGGQGHTEILDIRTANKFTQRQRLAQVAKMERDVRAAIIDPVAAGSDIGTLANLGSQAVMANTQFFDNYTQKVHYLRGVTHAIDSLGIDAKPLRDAINQSAPQVPARNRISQSQLADIFRDFPNRANQLTPVPDVATILNNFRPAARRDPKIAVFIDNLKNKNYQEALNAAKQINKRSTFRPDDWEQVVESTRRLRDQAKYLKSDPIFDEKKVARIQAKLDKFVANNPPARFKSAIVNQATDKVIAQYADHPDFDTIIKGLIAEGNYSQYPGLSGDMERAVRQASRTWQEIRDSGVDPVFIHHVTEESANAATHPSVVSHVPTESWAAKRTTDITPYVHDATVAIPHQVMELLRRNATQEYLDTFIRSHARHAEQPLLITDDTGNIIAEKPALIDDYLDRARRRFPNNPERVRGEAQRLMKREWAIFDPNTILPKSGKLTNFGNQQQYWVPKTSLRNLERIHTPMQNGFTAIMDPVMKTFRTSVLALSPRWQINNLIGGGMLAVAEDPGILLYMQKAMKMVKGELKHTELGFPEELARVADKIGIGTGIGQLPRESLEWNKLAAKTMFQYSAGTTLKRLYESAGKAREIASGFTQKMYDANAFIDDAYRAAAYMRGEAKALKAGTGMTPAQAEAAGIQLSRKILQKWDQMTPIERSIMRYTFPFYGWAAHIIPYVLKYPFDHPWRAEIMSNFTRNEIEDMGTGLPERFLNAFFLGKPDKNGNVKAIQMGSLNPFAGVANYFTWAGFVGNVNPVLGSILEALGVNTMSGSPDLYPDLTYDPETGRVVTKGKSFLPALLSNTIPQSQILMDLFGASNDFKSLLQSDPQAAARRLLSAGGIPLLYRQFNVPQEQFKAELAREAAQNTAKSKALKSGNIDTLNQYPALRGYVAQLQALQQQGRLAPYNPMIEQESILAALQGAVNPL